MVLCGRAGSWKWMGKMWLTISLKQIGDWTCFLVPEINFFNRLQAGQIHVISQDNNVEENSKNM